jgi:hypothetical protein
MDGERPSRRLPVSGGGRPGRAPGETCPASLGSLPRADSLVRGRLEFDWLYVQFVRRLPTA